MTTIVLKDTATPDEVSEFVCSEAPNLKINAEIIYESGTYYLWIEDIHGEWHEIGYFPEDVAHIMLNKFQETRFDVEDTV